MGACKKIVFHSDAFVAMVGELESAGPLETGGILLGTIRDETWYIVEHIDPGYLNVVRTVVGFEYDQEYVNHLAAVRNRAFGEALSVLGLWHRHPGSLDFFTPTDRRTNEGFARLSDRGAVSLILNLDPILRISAFHLAREGEYSRIETVEVAAGDLPDRIGERRSIRAAGWTVTKGAAHEHPDPHERAPTCGHGADHHRPECPGHLVAGLLPRADE